MSEARDDTVSSAEAGRYLCFSLGAEKYGIPLLSVREVIGVPSITPVPNSPPHFLGILNLRGQIISVIDLRQKLGKKAQSGAETSIVICDLNPLCVGMVVDAIHSVLAPEANQISAPPLQPQNSKNSEYITGVARVNEELILLLNVGKALSVEEMTAIKNGKAA